MCSRRRVAAAAARRARACSSASSSVSAPNSTSSQPVPVGQHRDLARVQALALHVVDEHLVDRLAAPSDPSPSRRARGRRRRRSSDSRGSSSASAFGHGCSWTVASRTVAQVPSLPDQRAGDVEAVLGQQLVEVVARHAPRDLRVALADRGRRSGRAGRAARRRSRARRPPPAMIASSSSSLVAPTRIRGAVVASDDLDRRRRLSERAPGHDRVRAAGVVADHAAERRVGVGRGVGRERESRARPSSGLASWSRITPGWTRASRRSGSTSRIARMCREVSIDDRALVRLAGERRCRAPREVIGAPCARQDATAATTSSASRGQTTPIGAWR